jgi:hypothetical protein
VAPSDASRGLRPACKSSFFARYLFRAASGLFQGPKKCVLPRIFLARTPAACGNRGKSGEGLDGLPFGVGALDTGGRGPIQPDRN